VRPAADVHGGLLAGDDRGLAYGDGLFETLRVDAAGRVPLWPRHRARLLAGARRLAIAIDAPALERCLADTLAGAPGAGVAKLIVTRGGGGRGYLPPAAPRPTLIGRFAPLPVYSDAERRRGIETGLCRLTLPDDPLAGLKHLNRLPQVLARAEVASQGWREGIVLNARRQPVEATAMNLFALYGDTLWTPALERAGVAGVARQWLLEQAARHGLRTSVRLRPLSQLRVADGVFLANSVVGVLPVRKLAQWVWPVPETVIGLQGDLDALFQA
tara:strand:+ start:76232 stop:77047 length:816 start_codon:yes stop_codon:yes gene_type:complete